jgi:prepilin-type N-terminal cleavage/methylation domain-containing protein
MMKNSRRNDSGVTLIELLVSLVVITSVLIPILNFFNSTLRQNNQDRELTKIRFLAEEELERVVSLTYDDSSLDAFGNSTGQTAFFEHDKYLVKQTVVLIDPETGEIPERYPYQKSDDTFLKRITISAAKQDKLGGQVDLVYLKSP